MQELLNKIDRYKKVIDAHRPLSPEEVKALDDYFRIGLTYSSNAIEGNTLTITETKVLLEDGLTVGGKPIKDCYEATGHAKAYDYMLEKVRSASFDFGEDVIKRFHYLFYVNIDAENAGKYRDHQVFISGTEYIPPKPEDVPEMMAEMIADLKAKENILHPVLLAAYAHKRLVDIHPFTDGNGRCARLLMNLILINKGYQITTIPPVRRHEYISALQLSQRAKNPSDKQFNTLIAECVLEAQRDYCRMFQIDIKS